MLVLFDQSTPAPLRLHLSAHTVTEARERGWDRLANADLLNAAEAAGFEVFPDSGQKPSLPTKPGGRQIAIVVIGNAQWRVLRYYVERVVSAVDAATPGSYTEVDIPFR
jgi:hypothetical protein